MNMFEEIDKVKKDLPKINSLSKKITNYKYNWYQILAFVLFFICFIVGIVLGNMFPACGSTSFYSDVCLVREFNFSLMIFIWACGFLGSTFFFALGQIIALLDSINNKLK